MNPKISIILPVYNGERYLRECLDSIIAQTLDDFELICVNDGSTDGTREILFDYQKRDPRIRILDQENSGYGRSMNRGIDEASGTYIAVVESDDCIQENMLLTLFTAAEKSQAEVVKADYYEFIGEENQRQLTYMQTVPEKSAYGRLLDSTQTTALFYAVQMTWEGIYRRSFLLEHQIRHNESPGASFQDNGFWFQVFARAKKVLFINEPLYMYRIDNSAASTKQSDLAKINKIFEEYDFILRFLEQNPEDSARLYPTYLHFRFDNTLARFFCASDDCKLEIALRIQSELQEAIQCDAFSLDLFGTALRNYLMAILDDPKAFSENPPKSINAICWEEVAGRPTAAMINPDAEIPASVIQEYQDGLPGSKQKYEGVRLTC